MQRLQLALDPLRDRPAVWGEACIEREAGAQWVVDARAAREFTEKLNL